MPARKKTCHICKECHMVPDFFVDAKLATLCDNHWAVIKEIIHEASSLMKQGKTPKVVEDGQ